MSSKKVLKTFLFWVVIAILVNVYVFFLYGQQLALEFLGGYIVELTLSIDNLFLFLLIFTSFNIPQEYQQRVLNYGIIGAVFLRLLFISLGITIIGKFHWVLYIFGILLIISGIKIFFTSDKQTDFSNNKLLVLIRHIIPVTNTLHKESFFVRENKILYATPLLLILILIESSDVIFALDSIPAIFAITTNTWIVYGSNVLAILGLRSLYFLLVKLNDMFKYIKYGVAFILIFTGIKLSILFFHISINIVISLMIILIILLLSLLFSLIID